MAKQGSTPKKDVLALEPEAFSQVFYEINGQRMFYVCLGKRTIGRGTSATGAWDMALKKLNQERERDNEKAM